MDSLTHALLGVAVAALRRPLTHQTGLLTASPPHAKSLGTDDRAVLLACVLSAELPDLDYLWPAADPVLHALKAHRGISHSLLAAPVVALIATLLSKLVFRETKLPRIYPWSLLAVLAAHLTADAWTGWGTRLFLPLSDVRVTLDWMMVVDPLFTLPLLVGTLWAIRTKRFRKPVLVGFAVASFYLASRIFVQQALSADLRRAYPNAESVQVFPSWLNPTAWRYVAVLADQQAAGSVGIFSQVHEQARVSRTNEQTLSAHVRAVPTVQEAIAWARFPIISETSDANGNTRVRVGDLRYHLRGAPTLTFIVDIDREGRVRDAHLDRGGSVKSLLERFRGQR